MKLLEIFAKIVTAFFSGDSFWKSREKRLDNKSKKAEIEKPLLEKKVEQKVAELERKEEVAQAVHEKVVELVGEAELTKFQEKRIKKKDSEGIEEESKMRTSDLGIKHLKEFEELRLEAYDDLQPKVKLTPTTPIKGTLTIGYGDTENVSVGMKITEQEAEERLKRQLQYYESRVNGLGLNLTQNEFDSLISWTYNTFKGSVEALNKRSLIRAIREYKSNKKTSSELAGLWESQYITSKGVPLPGLVRRRKSEVNIFLNAKY